MDDILSKPYTLEDCARLLRRGLVGTDEQAPRRARAVARRPQQAEAPECAARASMPARSARLRKLRAAASTRICIRSSSSCSRTGSTESLGAIAGRSRQSTICRPPQPSVTSSHPAPRTSARWRMRKQVRQLEQLCIAGDRARARELHADAAGGARAAARCAAGPVPARRAHEQRRQHKRAAGDHRRRRGSRPRAAGRVRRGGRAADRSRSTTARMRCEAALANDVAIVLLDVDMPGIERLRSVPPPARGAALRDAADRHGHRARGFRSDRAAFEAGATDFISKPVNWALLPRRLEYILRNAAAAEHIERLAYFDPLTGLPNRQRCIETAERCSMQAAAVAASPSRSSISISTVSSA